MNEFDQFEMPTQHCPVCRYSFDAATRIWGEGGPDPGSFTLCLKCGSVLRWNHRMDLYALTAAELRELPGEILLQLAWTQKLLFRVKAQRN